MDAKFLAGFLANPGPISGPMRRVLIRGLRAMTPSERDELWSEWYRIDPDSLERLIRDMPMPQREEFHNLLIKKHNRSQPT